MKYSREIKATRVCRCLASTVGSKYPAKRFWCATREGNSVLLFPYIFSILSCARCFLMTTHARGSWNSNLLRQDWSDEDILEIHSSCAEKKHCKWQWHTKQSFVNVGEKAGGYLSRDLASVLRKLFPGI